MIVSTGRGYVFVHIPKTGGTALMLALEDHAKRDDILIGDTPKARRRRHRLDGVETRGRLWKHSSLADIEGLIPDATLRGLFAFTLVRNPWDRAVSYYHWLRVQRFEHPAVALAHRLEFCAFVTHPQTRASLAAHPAAAYMRHADGTEQCAAFIRIERFAEESRPLVDHLGFDLVLPRANMSERARDYRPYFDARAAEAIAQSCATDIARFGYSFDTGVSGPQVL